jgi:hypothetical protein
MVIIVIKNSLIYFIVFHLVATIRALDCFEHVIPVQGFVTSRTIVNSARRFEHAPTALISLFTDKQVIATDTLFFSHSNLLPPYQNFCLK